MKNMRFLVFLGLLANLWCLVLADTVVYVSGYPNWALWKTQLPLNNSRVLLYGHSVGDYYLIPSPDGKNLAASDAGRVGIFDVNRPGIRRTIVTDANGFEFLGDWAMSGLGVLASRFPLDPQDMGCTYLGVYELRDGYRKRIVPPIPTDCDSAGSAKYSPDRSLLAIKGSGWLQVVKATPGSPTVLFKKKDNLASLPSIVWLDNNRFVLIGYHELVLVDVSKRTLTPWLHFWITSSLTYSKVRNRLYLTVMATPKDDHALYSVAPNADRLEKLATPGLVNVTKVFGVTADGKTAIVLAKDPSAVSSTAKTGVSGIWAVDLDSGEHTLIAEGATMAAILPSPASTPKAGK